MGDVSYQFLSSLSPRIKPNIRNKYKGPTILSLKHHIRRSSHIDKPRTVPNESLSIIEISSTDSSSASMPRSSKSPDTKSKSVNEIEASRLETKTPSHISLLSQEEFVSPSPQNCNESFRCLSTGKKNILRENKRDLNIPRKNLFGVEKWLNDVEKATAEVKTDVLEPSIMSYEEFERKSDENVVSSTMIIDVKKDVYNERNRNQISGNDSDNEEKCNKSYENLLDDIYGSSWRLKKDDILPKSEKKFKQKNLIGKQTPKSERKPAKPDLFIKPSNVNVKKPSNVNVKKPSNDTPKMKFKVSLKNLQDQGVKKVKESPIVKKLKNICDEETDEESITKIDNGEAQYNERNSSTDISDKENTPYSGKKKNLLHKPEKTLSFLASLSKDVPSNKCDLSAKIFKNSYAQYREELAKKLFKLYNEKIFGQAIPENTKLEWNARMLSTAGYCYSKKITHKTGVVTRESRIELSSKVLDSAERLRDTLIHEMCHAATWIIDEVRDGHGVYWKAWASKAMKVFPELPPIKTCHNYKINTKYVYKCTGCGYSIGRHRKSLDIERKRCGYCLGKFEVFINKTDKNGEQKVVSTPKKEPTGFALFVKENYSDLRVPGKTHAEVMKQLSENFRKIKV